MGKKHETTERPTYQYNRQKLVSGGNWTANSKHFKASEAKSGIRSL